MSEAPGDVALGASGLSSFTTCCRRRSACDCSEVRLALGLVVGSCGLDELAGAGSNENSELGGRY